MLPPNHTRRWQRLQADLPLRVFVSKGSSDLVVPGRATEISPGGICFCAGIDLNPGDLLEIEFDEPVYTRVMGVIRNRSGYTFWMEFVSPLPTEEN
jgi:PilZ domain